MDEEDRAKDELKRIDHLIFVTLKYTRTVDVIRTILSKFILTIDYKTEQYQAQLYDKGKIDSVQRIALLRLKQVEKRHPKDAKIKDLVDFYVMLKRVYNEEYRPREEYRKNVTLVTIHQEEVNIPNLKEYAELTKEYVYYIGSLMQ